MLVQNQAWRDLELGPSAMQGQGLFAKRPIAAGALITIVVGTHHRGAYDGDFADGPTWYGVGHGKWIEPDGASPARFLNHSCEPNAAVVEGVQVVAVRDILPGEEVTIDYGTTEEDPGWQMPCRCGTASCRNVIRAEAKFPG